jgi:uncharacterized membrane protein YbhN (UPF0104 family)
MKNNIKIFLQFLISGAFIAGCIRMVSPEAFVETFMRGRPLFLAVVLLLMPPAIIIRAWRWWYIITRKEGHVPFWPICKATLIGHAYNIFLPASLGDFVRSYYGWRELGNKEVMLASSIVDKVVALFSLSLLGFGCSAAIGTHQLTLVSGILTVALGVLLFIPRIIPWQWGVYLFKKYFRKEMNADRLASTFHLDRVTLLGSIGISLLGWVATNMMYYYSWRAFSPDVPLWYSFAVAPLINLMRMLPMTVSGIGSTDMFIVFLFRTVGMPESVAFAGSMVINVVLIILPGVIGAGFMVKRGNRWVQEPR